MELKEELLTLNFSHPRFPFYITFVKNEAQTVQDYKEVARNFEVPWDVKPVDEKRLAEICTELELNGWAECKPHFQMAFTILREMQNFKSVTVFTIPSMPKRTFFRRFFRMY